MDVNPRQHPPASSHSRHRVGAFMASGGAGIWANRTWAAFSSMNASAIRRGEPMSKPAAACASTLASRYSSSRTCAAVSWSASSHQVVVGVVVIVSAPIEWSRTRATVVHILCSFTFPLLSVSG